MKWLQMSPCLAGYSANTSMTAVRPNTLTVSHAYQPAYSGTTGLAPAVQGMPQGGLQVSAPNNNADYEALRSQAHETYRNGDFHSALQLCQSVRLP